MPPENLFILAGNGSYRNRGCEAIVRGTTEIIRKYFPNPQFLVCSEFSSDSHLESQIKSEFDPAVRHVKIERLPQARNRTLNRALWRVYKLFPGARREFTFKGILPYMARARAVLSVGGDNYSFDYGTLLNWTDLDDMVLSKKKKLVIWGASIGPFGDSPEMQRRMGSHFMLPAGILARDNWTVNYLSGLSVSKNVYAMRDPAFLLETKKPADIPHDLSLGDSIGINLSPLMGKFACGGDSEAWLKLAGDIVEAIRKEFGKPILLVPHATEEADNDYTFLKKLCERFENLPSGPAVKLVPNRYNASESKWFISQCRVFMGARMHSTIAAYSSHVPTLSLSYSPKSQGLSEDIYGNRDLCLKAAEIAPGPVCAALRRLVAHETSYRRLLEETMPRFRQKAYEGGEILAALLKSSLTAA